MRKWVISGLFAIFLVENSTMIPMRTARDFQSSPINPKDNYLIVELQAIEDQHVLEKTIQTDQALLWLEDLAFESVSDTTYIEGKSYQITQICVDEPILARMLEPLIDQIRGVADGDRGKGETSSRVAVYDVVSFQQSDDDEYDFNLQVSGEADCTVYQSIEDEVEESVLEAVQCEDDSLWRFSYSAKSNHWLILYITYPQENATKENADLEKNTIQKDKSKEKSTKENELKEQQLKETIETAYAIETIHSHNWEKQVATVHHDAVYQQIWKEDMSAYDETVVVKEPWTEECMVQEEWEEPVYSEIDSCNVCGYQYPLGSGIEEYSYHQFIDPGDGGSWHTEKIQTGSIHHDAVYERIFHDAETKTIHHEEQGHYEEVLVEEAWDETVITGSICIECGAVQENE